MTTARLRSPHRGQVAPGNPKSRFIIGVAGLAIVASTVWLALWATLVPLATGWSPVAVTSGSMQPLIRTGDLVLSVPHDGGQLNPGAVATFDNTAGDGWITHRIARQDDDGFYVTRGDANARADSTPVAPESIHGVGRLLIPSMGKPFVWVENGDWAHLLATAGGLALAVWVSRWALLPRFDPWLNPGSAPARRPTSQPTKRRTAAVALLAAAMLLGNVATGSSAVFAARTDTDSTEVTSDTLAPPTSLISEGYTVAKMKWTPTPDTWATGHRVYRSATSGGPYTMVAEVTPQAADTYIDAAPLGTWYYVVRAYVANWESVDSNESSSTVIEEDFDAVVAVADNCPTTFNIDQFDTDGDTQGDACDLSPTVASSAQFVATGQPMGAADTFDAAMADLDGDGALDIVYANQLGAANTVWMGVGNGKFIDSTQALGAGDSRGIALGDIDDDGDPDLIVANRSRPNRIWLNDGTGTYTDSGQALGTASSYASALGDVDGDGDLDLVFANSASQPNTIWLNDGTGTYTDSGQTLGTSDTRGTTFGDLDGDDDLDITFSNAGSSPNTIWLNDGTGTYTDSGQTLGTRDTRGAALGDVDGDGDRDIAFANFGGQPNTVWLNDGAGVFTDSGQALGADASAEMALADLDGDGDLDTIATTSLASTRVHLNNGTGTFTDSGSPFGSSTTMGLAVGDVDADGDLDMALANSLGNPNTVWLNDESPEDFDAVPVGIDNCPTTFNPDQFDTDGDSLGDACDPSPTLSTDGIFILNGQALGNKTSESVAVGDLDGDGDIDITYANYFGDPNTVWLNDGSGQFVDSGQALGSNDSEAIEVGDLDGDGDLDIIVGNTSGEADQIYFNGGSANFTDSGQALGNTDTEIIEIGDVDGDGDLDFVTAVGFAGNKVWLNNGSGVFTDSGQSLGSADTEGMAIGDLDGDSDLDLVFANDGTANTVWFNNGSGIFTDSGQDLGNSMDSEGAAIADFDGDGDSDITIANRSVPNTVWLNNGTGTFTDSGQTLGVAPSESVGVGDFDGDGDIDITYGNFPGPNTIWLNSGAGTFTDSGQTLGTSTSEAIAIADLDGDGDLDVTYANNFDSQPNRVWLNNGVASDDFDAVPAASDNCPTTFNIDQFDTDGDSTGDACDPSPSVTTAGTFVDSGQSLGAAKSRDTTFADLDADGDLDLVVSTAASQATTVWFNDGVGTYTNSGQSLGTASSLDAAIGDLDGDGDLDITIANRSVPNTVWLNNGTGTFTNSGQTLGTAHSVSVVLGDVNGDGDLDITYGNFPGPNTIWLNNGAGVFTNSGQSLGADNTYDLGIGDVDGDADLDLVFANYSSQANTVWLNDGSGTYTDSGQSLSTANTHGVALADLDGDGDLEIAFANQSPQANTVWSNNGSGVFSDTGQALSGANARGVEAADLDGDGDLDLTFANTGGANTLWRNNGSGVFVLSAQLLDAADSWDTALGDVDGDGDLDIATANLGQPDTIWFNEPVTTWTSPLAVWRRDGQTTRYFDRWNGTGFDGVQTSGVTGNFRILQGARSDTRNEALLIGVDADGKIGAERWDGSSWTSFGASLGGTDQAYWWGFDVAYESLSGDAVFVNASGTTLTYDVWDGTALTPGAAPITLPIAGTPRQMQLAADPTSDEMVLIVSNEFSQDYALVWSGSAWGNSIPLDSSGVGNDRTDVNVAYEQQSGRAIVTYGKGTGQVFSRIWDSGWSGETPLAALGTGYARWTTLAADPHSNNIALGVLTSGNEVWVATWTNVGWINQTLATSTSTGTTELAVAVGFEGSSGQALATFGDGTTTPGTMTWTAGASWTAGPDVPTLGAVSNSMVLYGDGGSDGIMLAVQDDASDLHWIHWNGTAWGTDNELETDSGETKNQPFLFIP